MNTSLLHISSHNSSSCTLSINLDKRWNRGSTKQAIQGSVTLLHKLLGEDPIVLDRVTFGCFGGSPLHVAALRGHEEFVTEVLHLNPDLAEVLDASQRSPCT
ncbi:hypothetical protein ACSBR1_040930 [Camellia fascicularis]